MLKYIDPSLNVNTNRALGVVVARRRRQRPDLPRVRAHLLAAGIFGHGWRRRANRLGRSETGISVGYATNGFVDPIAMGRRITAIGSLALANCGEVIHEACGP